MNFYEGERHDMEVMQEDSPLSVTPPRVVIDLSLPPRARYKAIAKARVAQLRTLTSLYENLLVEVGVPPRLVGTVQTLSRLFLRKVYESEQTEELRGIAEVSGIPMYLLVAFNVLLDLLMGCTSGGVQSLEEGQSPTEARMLHFRTLDWRMDPLRKVVVQLDFVRSRSSSPDKIIASSITYIGFVGVLTGVRPGLSMSLNFRAVHDATTKWEHFKFYLHHLLVLFGWRPSIASILRWHLLNPAKSGDKEDSLLELATADVVRHHTTAAYLIFSSGTSTVTIEKDYSTSVVNRSSTFIARTNHDVEDHKVKQSATPAVADGPSIFGGQTAGLGELLEESHQRLGCIANKWKDKVKETQKSQRSRSLSEEKAFVSQEELINWLCTWTTTNECTHYAVIMDPRCGQVIWCKAYPNPLTDPNWAPDQWFAMRKGRRKHMVSLAART